MDYFYGHGKLLLTAEYLVLLGAEALALPCRYGQSLTIENSDNNTLHWQSFTQHKKLWFEAKFELYNLRCIETTNPTFSDRLTGLLLNVRELQPGFLAEGTVAKTHLEFDRAWGLGSSSTLVSMLGAWGNVDPYHLLKNSFGGSGYDIACAAAKGPICYHNNKSKPSYKNVRFDPPFKDRLFFVYRNQKQNSQDEVAAFHKKIVLPEMINQINTITKAILNCSLQSEFNQLIREHEMMLASILGKDPVQQSHFPDFKGQLKSLGAWGGDFILASGDRDTPAYFHSKGYATVIQYKDLIFAP